MDNLDRVPGSDRWRSSGEDVLLKAIVLLVVLILGVLGSLLWYVLHLPDAPRTATERAISVAESELLTAPGNLETRASLALIYAEAGRYREARDVVEIGLGIDDGHPGLALVSAEIARLQGDLDEALQGFTAAQMAAVDRYDIERQRELERGVSQSPVNIYLVNATIAKARLLVELGREIDALSEYDVALGEEPTMSDVLVERGDLLAATGDHEAAREDYERALEMLPGYEPAIEGLQRIGTE